MPIEFEAHHGFTQLLIEQPSISQNVPDKFRKEQSQVWGDETTLYCLVSTCMYLRNLIKVTKHHT